MMAVVNLRFIPAGAGNTRFSASHSMRSPVYPRWRGEHPVDEIGLFFITGLSPLARGTLIHSARRKPVRRFIPAGAGNTSGFVGDARPSAVYPRWRGEHLVGELQEKGIYGLSPLARGTLFLFLTTAFTGRFIPAGAGNTRFTTAGISNDSVYPRWRGEHPFCE